MAGLTTPTVALSLRASSPGDTLAHPGELTPHVWELLVFHMGAHEMALYGHGALMPYAWVNNMLDLEFHVFENTWPNGARTFTVQHAVGNNQIRWTLTV